MVGSRKRRKARDPDTSSCSPEKKLASGGSPSASPPQVQKRGKYSQHQAGNVERAVQAYINKEVA